MWLKDINRKYYNLNEEEWKAVKEEMIQKYKSKNIENDFSKINYIAEILSIDEEEGEEEAELWYSDLIKTRNKDLKLVSKTFRKK